MSCEYLILLSSDLCNVIHLRVYLVGFVLLDLWFDVYCFVDSSLSFCPFWGAIVLCALLRFTAFDYPFGIFKLFLHTLRFFLILMCVNDLTFLTNFVIFITFRRCTESILAATIIVDNVKFTSYNLAG